jgi:phosphoribosylamine--glycine ligase
VWALTQSLRCENIYVAPGNGGTARVAKNITTLDINDGQALSAFAKAHNIDMVVIGPEGPLALGVGDVLRKEGLAVFGPGEQGALLESSKTYSKEFMLANNIPTARYQSCVSLEEALIYLEEVGAPIVVKADGLAAGKGVAVCETLEDAKAAIKKCFEGAFGEAGNRVVIEEYLKGPECSLLAVVTGGQSFCMQPAQDHKRAFDGDLGPNTGGMGVYSPVPIVSAKELDSMKNIMQISASATARSPFTEDFRGILYGGFVLTHQGPKVLEFNVRFGDPETQVVLPRLKSDLLEVLWAASLGKPTDIVLEWSDKWAVCVVLASAGYPGNYEIGKVILGIDEAEELEGVLVFHAGTTHNVDGELISAGGRVLNVVGLGDSFEEAQKRAYKGSEKIHFEGKQYRSDIGNKEIKGRSAWE